jgi:hypothetical protein
MMIDPDRAWALGMITMSQGERQRSFDIMAAWPGMIFPALWCKEFQRAQPGDEGFEQAWQEGRAMSMEEAIEYALEQPQVNRRD